MTLGLEDRLAIGELIALHGHVVDDGQLDRMDELFTPDIVYDVSDFGQEPLVGLAAVRDAALALGDGNPVAHHVTNIVVREEADGRVRARSKGLGVRADGTCGSVTYDDVLVRTPDGWRISHRTLTARRVPLNGVHRSG
ncbi:polyketide cyclase [Streptomyces sp. MUSC 14]|uniref:nuclear transport factor 2 family protein n=1 Tax=Streptomyces sp. MUSC 14 TaxID=1354889 RepID=UPI0008F5B4EC|nr:nuclear transport factor 2 family protein [Streptomyces sp. MUSC 14]OIJ88997.1 polyketide cyclase [Streptomyces sp. MUSC 14]